MILGRAKVGVLCALGASLGWACTLFYYKALRHVSAAEILAHRILWSALLLVGLLALRGRLRATARALRNLRTAVTLAATTCLLACAWYVFVWAVVHDRVMETSMGHFIYPLVSAALGFLFLQETFHLLQLAALLLACLAVAILGISDGRIPALSLVVAIPLAFYGLLRKRVTVDGVAGLAAETLLLSPFALLYLVRLDSAGALAFAHADRLTDLLLIAAGLVTAGPLVLFIEGARRLRYATLGVLQYTLPTMTFLIAVFIFDEPFSPWRLAAFGVIWVAAALYFAPSARESLSLRRAGTTTVSGPGSEPGIFEEGPCQKKRDAPGPGTLAARAERHR